MNTPTNTHNQAKSHHWPRFTASIALVLAMSALLAACSVPSSINLTTSGAGAAAITQPSTAAPAIAPAASAGTSVPTAAASTSAMTGDFSTAIRNVVQKIKPAVVQITNEQYQVDGFTNQPFTVPAGVGSAVIYDDQGHILTNNHVVAGAQQLTVALPDGSTYPATLVGADPYTDLAVLKINGANLPVASFGDSSQLQVGDWVVAIGNALALPGGPTVSTGVVSALGRTVQEPGENGGAGPYLFDVVQTDAPINPGNSGGPLVDLQGRVIGINTLVAGQAEPGVQAQGIGFAISIASAKPIADQLVAHGQAVHPYIGIQQVPLNPVIGSRLGADQKTGVVVVSVGPGTPAAAAGLRPRDIITAIDGVTLVDDSDFAKSIDSHKPGDSVELTVVRGKQMIQIKATLAERPTE
ncbi:MAG TPA: trypsin-like peptidase domain-containing protein [Roseiflexaceae bacterium]|nr:trypsin-like peptidase domain-containing protein [Roseiflexaceae bacterium]